MSVRPRFTNPANNDTYDWAIGHDEEDEFGKSRSIEYGATTSNNGFVKQQSDDSPMVLRLRGTILQQAQIEEFIAWWKLCETQTIYFRDFTGDEYEVLISSFKPTRQRTIKNPRGGTDNPLHYWEYEIAMEVIRFRSGMWADAAVTP